MGPLEPPEEGILSKIMVFGALAILLVILGACAYFIYGFISPAPEPAMPTPTLVPTPTVVITPTPMITPTPTPQPTLQIEPTPDATDVPVVRYEYDTRVTDWLKIATPPGVWDRFVVFDERVSDNDYKVHLFDLNALTDEVIATGNVRSYGAIGNSKVVLINGEDTTVKVYDIPTKGQIVASPAKSFPRAFPTVFDEYVVYTGNEGGWNQVQGQINIYSLYTYRLSDGLYSMWAVNVPEPREPRGDGNYIVWWQISDGKKQVVLYDIKKATTKTISTDNCDHPRIYDNYIIYHNGADHHIYLYDISTGNTRKIISIGRQYSADIYGSKIVYDDNRAGNWDIYMLDLSTGKETQLTNEPHDQMSPQIYGDNVIYMDNRNNASSWDIYMIKA